MSNQKNIFDEVIKIFGIALNLFFIIYIKVSWKIDPVLECKAEKWPGNQFNVNAFESIFGHLTSDKLSNQHTLCQ